MCFRAFFVALWQFLHCRGPQSHCTICAFSFANVSNQTKHITRPKKSINKSILKYGKMSKKSIRNVEKKKNLEKEKKQNTNQGLKMNLE